jgi:hypothetical protein
MTQERTISINYNHTVNLEAERAARRQALVCASDMQLLAKCSNVTSEANLFPPPCYPIKNCHLPPLKAHALRTPTTTQSFTIPPRAFMGVIVGGTCMLSLYNGAERKSWHSCRRSASCLWHVTDRSSLARFSKI